MSRSGKLATVWACGLLVTAAQAQTTRYVDDDAAPGGDGLSWSTAHKFLQEALALAVNGDEVRVAGGSYRPDEDDASPDGTGGRTATFQLISGVVLYGGYRGCLGGDCGSGNPDERDIDLYRTILSGDLLGNDEPVSCTEDFADCYPLGERCIDGFCMIEGNNSENACHVVTGSYTDETAVLHGFTITAGNAGGGPCHNGAGVLNETGSPTFAKCRLIGNSAISGGGGMSNRNDSSPTLTNCTFSGNTAYSAGGMCISRSSPTLVDCTFTGNSARTGGGSNP